jgi:hypothetical protein
MEGERTLGSLAIDGDLIQACRAFALVQHRRDACAVAAWDGG